MYTFFQRKFIFFFLLLWGTQPVSAVCAPQKHQPLPRLNGNMNYTQARTALINAGWQPKKNTWQYFVDHPANYPGGNFRRAYDLGYWEVNDCSGTGLGFCGFYFGDVYGNTFKVVTAGVVGEPSSQKVFDTNIYYWEFSCEE